MAWGTATFDQNGGTGGETRTLYYYYADNWLNYWASAKNTGTAYRVTTCTVPTKEGALFDGYFSGTKQYFNSKGSAITGSVSGATLALTAKWVAYRTVTLDRNGGTGGSGALYYDGAGYYLDAGLTEAAAAVEVPSYGGRRFLGYYSADGNTQYIGADGTFTSALTGTAPWSDFTITAKWGRILDDTDYFGAEGDELTLVASTDGAGRTATETSNAHGQLAVQAADSAVGAFKTGGREVNPVCTFRVKGAGTVEFTLGKAWNGTNGKYFLTKVEYRTGADAEPLVVLTGTANEGADAINTWAVAFAVSPDHTAQDPYGAISGGGELTGCTTVATADAVVCYEGGAACASDVVNGKVTVRGTTCAYFGESAPAAAGAFVEVNGVPEAFSDVDFTTYQIEAERSL